MRKSQSPRCCPGEKFSPRCISGTSSRENSPEHLVAPGIGVNLLPLFSFPRENDSEIVSDCDPSINCRKTRATISSFRPSINGQKYVIIISRVLYTIWDLST
ncbi:hypothetical protein PUN28_000759 [Cardiocondyla obscurior]|uniref:Uncharacterized protein n=1 Tax=Cardiocondyla obscurior TaxID=286306 RepID=A0AAW2H1F1_9HYME